MDCRYNCGNQIEQVKRWHLWYWPNACKKCIFELKMELREIRRLKREKELGITDSKI